MTTQTPVKPESRLPMFGGRPSTKQYAKKPSPVPTITPPAPQPSRMTKIAPPKFMYQTAKRECKTMSSSMATRKPGGCPPSQVADKPPSRSLSAPNGIRTASLQKQSLLPTAMSRLKNTLHDSANSMRRNYEDLRKAIYQDVPDTKSTATLNQSDVSFHQATASRVLSVNHSLHKPSKTPLVHVVSPSICQVALVSIEQQSADQTGAVSVEQAGLSVVELEVGTAVASDVVETYCSSQRDEQNETAEREPVSSMARSSLCHLHLEQASPSAYRKKLINSFTVKEQLSPTAEVSKKLEIESAPCVNPKTPKASSTQQGSHSLDTWKHNSKAKSSTFLNGFLSKINSSRVLHRQQESPPHTRRNAKSSGSRTSLPTMSACPRRRPSPKTRRKATTADVATNK